MVDELLYKKPTSYDMLCQIAIKFLGPKVNNLCRINDALQGRGYEDDILQDLCLHLIKVTVDKYFLKKDDNGNFKYPRNPAVFGKWLDTVAKNKLVDYATGVGENDNHVYYIDGENNDIAASEEIEETEQTDDLKNAFSIVLSSNAAIYKILTWLAQSIIILNSDLTRIKARDVVIRTFEAKTLSEMYAMIIIASKQIRWLEISDEQHQKIFASLKRSWDEKRCYGEVTYRELFMKYKGKVSSKKSISDWVNRMDSEVLRKTSGDYITKTQKKKQKKVVFDEQDSTNKADSKTNNSTEG